MRKYLISSLIVLFVICSTSLADGELTFAEWAALNGLDGSESFIGAPHAGINSLEGLANNYPVLECLDLDDNPIVSISQGDFAGLSNLQQLYLCGNQISSIGQGGFSGLDNLLRLDLFGNQIVSIDQGMFAGLSDLYQLDMRNNQISSIGQGGFTGLGNLQNLDLWTNQISSIEQGDFAGLNNLQKLRLGLNQISSIAPGGFSELSNLQELDLSNNPISSIAQGSLDGLNNLVMLALEENQISTIDSYAFAGMGNLNYLFLGNNLNLNILNLTGAGFSSLTGYFDVKGCPIEKVILTNAILNQNSFDQLLHDDSIYCDGIAEISGVLEVDFSGVDFEYITDLSKMYTMDDLVRLIFADATNLAGDEVASLLSELASMDYLDVTGAWDDWFDGGAFSEDQLALMAWDQVLGNTLVVPEPMTVCLLSFGAMVLFRKRKK